MEPSATPSDTTQVTLPSLLLPTSLTLPSRGAPDAVHTTLYVCAPIGTSTPPTVAMQLHAAATTSHHMSRPALAPLCIRCNRRRAGVAAACAVMSCSQGCHGPGWIVQALVAAVALLSLGATRVAAGAGLINRTILVRHVDFHPTPHPAPSLPLSPPCPPKILCIIFVAWDWVGGGGWGRCCWARGPSVWEWTSLTPALIMSPPPPVGSAP